MPHFSPKGNDTYICQRCARVFDSIESPSYWRTEITGCESAGNVCEACRDAHDEFFEWVYSRLLPEMNAHETTADDHKIVQGLISRCFRDGYTREDAYCELRYTEHVNPQFDEEYALGMMRTISSKYRQAKS